MEYRPHTGGYRESMSRTIEIKDLEELIEIVGSRDVKFEKYEDKRNDWDNHWVIVNGYPIGTLNGKL